METFSRIFVSNRYSKEGDKGLLTKRFMRYVTSPCIIKLTGKLQLIGLLQVSFIDDILKRAAITMACHSLTDKYKWHSLIPLIAREIYALMKAQVPVTEKSDSRIISKLFECLFVENYVTAMSYVNESFYSVSNSVELSVEFETSQNEIFIMKYRLDIYLSTVKIDEKDYYLQRGFKLLEPVNQTWDVVCTFVMDRLSTTLFSPHAVLQLLAPLASPSEYDNLHRDRSKNDLPKISIRSRSAFSMDDSLQFLTKVEDFIRFYGKGNEGPLTRRVRSIDRSTGVFELHGKLELVGSVRASLIDDILKRVAITIACHTLFNSESLYPLIPYIAKKIYDLSEGQTPVIKNSDSKVPLNVLCLLEGKYALAEPWLVKAYPYKMPTAAAAFTWEFVTNLNETLVVRYKLGIVANRIDNEPNINYLKTGYEIIKPVDYTWDAVCTFVINHFSKTSFNPHIALLLANTFLRMLVPPTIKFSEEENLVSLPSFP